MQLYLSTQNTQSIHHHTIQQTLITPSFQENEIGDESTDVRVNTNDNVIIE